MWFNLRDCTIFFCQGQTQLTIVRSHTVSPLSLPPSSAMSHHQSCKTMTFSMLFEHPSGRASLEPKCGMQSRSACKDFMLRVLIRSCHLGGRRKVRTIWEISCSFLLTIARDKFYLFPPCPKKTSVVGNDHPSNTKTPFPFSQAPLHSLVPSSSHKNPRQTLRAVLPV